MKLPSKSNKTNRLGVGPRIAIHKSGSSKAFDCHLIRPALKAHNLLKDGPLTSAAVLPDQPEEVACV